jgi:hypothetical protein
MQACEPKIIEFVVGSAPKAKLHFMRNKITVCFNRRQQISVGLNLKKKIEQDIVSLEITWVC